MRSAGKQGEIQKTPWATIGTRGKEGEGSERAFRDGPAWTNKDTGHMMNLERSTSGRFMRITQVERE
jgi:hypothetical protein